MRGGRTACSSNSGWRATSRSSRSNGDITLNKGGDVLLKDKVQSLIQQGNKNIVIDLSGVAYVDSAGLGELVQAYATTKNKGGALKLVNVTKKLKDLLVVTKLLTVFDTFDDEKRGALQLQLAGGGRRLRAVPVEHPAQLADDLVELTRLDQHVRDPGVPKALGVVEVLGVSGDREDRDVARRGRLLQRAAELEPVHPRHREVGHDEIRPQLPRFLERLKSIVRVRRPEART